MIFVSIPKTGSRSIRHILGASDEHNHMARHKIPIDAKSFAVLRNPFDRLVSWYFGHKLVQPGLVEYQQPFNEWVMNGCPHHWKTGFCESRGITNPLNQYEFVTDKRGDINVDYLMRFESLQKDWKLFSRKFGFTQSLPRLGRSNHGAWQTYFNQEMHEKVKQLFPIDIAIHSVKINFP